MPPERVVEHLTHVLGVENVPFEEDALWLLGRAADGSMRDAMSLTDGRSPSVRARCWPPMCGDARHARSRSGLWRTAGAARGRRPGTARSRSSSRRAGAGLGRRTRGNAQCVDRVAIAQALPEAVDNGQGDRDRVLALAQALPAEDVQFYYQMGLIGRRDLPLAPDPRSGFEMVLLRMLAFRPADTGDAPRTSLRIWESARPQLIPSLQRWPVPLPRRVACFSPCPVGPAAAVAPPAARGDSQSG